MSPACAALATTPCWKGPWKNSGKIVSIRKIISPAPSRLTIGGRLPTCPTNRANHPAGSLQSAVPPNQSSRKSPSQTGSAIPYRAASSPQPATARQSPATHQQSLSAARLQIPGTPPGPIDKPPPPRSPPAPPEESKRPPQPNVRRLKSYPRL